jgi:hypothetical protein
MPVYSGSYLKQNSTSLYERFNKFNVEKVEL